MNFAQTTFLIATAAVAIPVVVHLLSRLQVRQLELGTMRFLQEVLQDGAYQRRIRRWFLLLTRASLVLLLALLFARPFTSEQVQRDGDRLRVIMIDRSASMGMPGREGRLLDDAITAAMNSVAEMPIDTRVLWAWFDSRVDPMPDDTIRPSTPEAAAGNTDYTAALRWARDRLDAFPTSRADVVLITDLQKSGMGRRVADAESAVFEADIPVQVIDVGRPAANNLAITSTAAAATRLKPSTDIHVTTTLFNYGTQPAEEVPAIASASNGEKTVRVRKSISVPGAEAEEISFDFGKLEAGTWRVTVAIDADDDLAIDNRRYTAVEVADSIPVLVLDSGTAADGSAAESYFIAAALNQSDQRFIESEQQVERFPTGRFAADVTYLQDNSPALLNPTQRPLTVVVNAGGVTEDVIEQLQEYVRDGGQLLVFAGEGTEERAVSWQECGLAPGQLSAPQRSGVMPFRIASVAGEETMMRPFADPQYADLSRLAFRKMLPVSAAESTLVLARFDQNRPALTQHEYGRGRVVWFLSSGDSSWGNWPTSPLYLPLVQQMAADLLQLTGEGRIRFRATGDSRASDGLLSARRRSEQDRRESSRMILTKTNRNGTPVSQPNASQATAGAPIFSRPGFDRHGDVLYVVNESARESDPARTQVSAFISHFGLTEPTTSGEDRNQQQLTDQRHEIWPWLAAIIMVLLIAEFSLSNRTAA